MTRLKSLLKLENVTKSFQSKRSLFSRTFAEHTALKDISLDIYDGRFVGICGESGAGKSTLARILIDLDQNYEGVIHSYKKNIKKSIVFQNPFASMNPKRTIMSNMTIGLVDTVELREELDRLLVQLQLDRKLISKYPHECSGGQLQRFAIARALLNKPDLLICDEILSSLDPSIQLQMIDVIKKLKKTSITIVFISHDLPVLKFLSDDIMVLYKGYCVESGSAEHVLQNPFHPYTISLIENSRLSLNDQSGGCVFSQKCPVATDQCFKQAPSRKYISNESHDYLCIL